MKITTEFDIGDLVTVDHAEGGVITSINVRRETSISSSVYLQYEISWLANGDVKSAYFDAWRIAKVNDARR